MKRLDWLDRLWDTIEAHRPLPFRWAGTADAHDCCTFAAACVDAISGRNLVSTMLELYQDEAGALAVIDAHGGLEDLVSSFLGAPAQLGFMQRGDVVVAERDGQKFVGICVGREIISAGPTGLVLNPARLALACWKP